MHTSDNHSTHSSVSNVSEDEIRKKHFEEFGNLRVNTHHYNNINHHETTINPELNHHHIIDLVETQKTNHHDETSISLNNINNRRHSGSEMGFSMTTSTPMGTPVGHVPNPFIRNNPHTHNTSVRNPNNNSNNAPLRSNPNFSRSFKREDSPIDIDEEELQPVNDIELEMLPTTSNTNLNKSKEKEEEVLGMESLPPLTEDKNYNQYFTGTPFAHPYSIRPSESMESLNSFSGDPTMNVDILNDEYMKSLVEKELTDNGETAFGKLIKKTAAAANAIEQVTGIPFSDKIPVVHSKPKFDNEEEIGLKKRKVNFLEKATEFAENKFKEPPMLLPSQKRALRNWFFKRSRNSMRFARSHQKMKKHGQIQEDEESGIGMNEFKIETDSISSTSNEEEEKFSEVDEIGYTSWKDRAKRILLSCLTGTSEKKQSKVLYKDLSNDDKMKVHSLLLDLGYALTAYGLSSNRVEYHLTLISTYFGLDAYYNCLPNGVWISFGQKPRDPNNSTYFIKIDSQAVNLDKLSKLNQVADNISHGLYTIDEAQDKINQIIQEPSNFSHPMLGVFIHFLTPGLFVLLWKGGIAELLTCLITGLLIGVINYFFSPHVYFGSIFPAVAAVVGGLTGFVMKYIFLDQYYVSISLVSLCTAYQFLPGSILCTAMYEISIGSLLSGITRITGAFAVILKLAFGLIVTSELVKHIPSIAESEANEPERAPTPIYLRMIVVLCLSICTMISRKVPKNWKTMSYIAFSSVTVHMVNYFLSGVLSSSELATTAAAVVVGILANLYSLSSSIPPVVVAGISMIMLAPGSISYRGVASLIWTNNAFQSIGFFFEVFLIGLSIFFGLMVANSIVPIKHKINV
ncbi:hypothetical protein ABK040_002422 [Willaertia magna]